MIPTPRPRAHGTATSADGTQIAWYRYGRGERAILFGEADAAVPAALAEGIVAAMPNARLELIPAGGHRPDIRTPELVNPLLLDFLVGVS